MSETLAAAQKRVSPEFSNSLNVEGALEDSTPTLTLTADQGDDAGDRWQVKNNDDAGLTFSNDLASKETFDFECLKLGNVLDTTNVAADASNVSTNTTSGEITFANVIGLVVGDRVKIVGGLLAAAFGDNADKVLFVKTVDATSKIITVSATNGGDVIKPTSALTNQALGAATGRVFQMTNTNTVGFGRGSATSIAGNLTVAGSCSGLRNSDVTSSNATTADIDLTAVSADHKLVLTGTFSALVKLPQATVNNVGMVIDVICAADTDNTDANTGVAVKQGDPTEMVGSITTGIVAGAAGKEATTCQLRANAQRIVLQSGTVNTAGGAKGSHYKFTYVGADLILVSGVGLVTGGTATAPTANTISTNTGFS